MTKAAILTGRHPAEWQRASGLVICKPGEDDYTQLKAYRSISLLSCMGKVVEKVVAELLSEEAERSGLLSDGQFTSRKDGKPSTQQRSWSTELTQPGVMAT